MKSENNIRYQRDSMIQLCNMYIDVLELKVNKKIEFDYTGYIYSIQNIINTAKALDWALNTGDDCDIADYYDSTHELELESQLKLAKLNSIIESQSKK